MQRDTTLPIGVPALFLLGGLQGRAPSHMPTNIARLVAEYHRARGHTFEWGHIVVTERPPLMMWRIVPVALWEHVAGAVPIDPLPCRSCCRCWHRWCACTSCLGFRPECDWPAPSARGASAHMHCSPSCMRIRSVAGKPARGSNGA
jgi:hypothetical protein